MVQLRKGTQVINGTEYVYEDKPYWDSDKKRGTHKRVYIGKNVNGEFIPNKKYLLQQELAATKANMKPGPVPTETCTRTFYGATYLLDEIGSKTGITYDLKTCFPDDYNAILSLAYFLVLENAMPIYRFKRWALSHEHPFGKDIPSQRSSELFGRIQEDAKMEFFRKQAKRRLEAEFLAYDTTSISSYSELIKFAKYGKNKEHDHLPQINLALLLGESTRLPAYYRKLPGNITDVKTLENLLKDIDFLQLDKVKIVMDRGFYSEANINRLFHDHHKFLIGVKTSLKFVRQKLDDIRDNFATRSNYHSGTKLYIQSFTMDWNYEEQKPRTGELIKDTRRIYLHFYYNDQHATDDKNAFNHMLDTLETELLSGHRNPEHEKLYTKYYDIHTTPIRGMKFAPKQEAIDDAEKDFGFFALMSNSIKEPVEALNIYRSKDLIEKAFGDLKERLNMRRESVSSDENLEGKLFVQFVALIYLCYIKKAMEDNNLFKTYSMQEFLDELDIIERFHQPGKQPCLGEITEKQKMLYKYMGVNEPT